MKTRTVFAATILTAAVLTTIDFSSRRAVVHAASAQAPRFEVDPLWPKPLPNHWVLGMVVGVATDAQDHVWIVHRPQTLERMESYAAANPPASECCAPAPPVLEFNQEGDLIGHWGGPGAGYDWPISMHGITIDPKGDVWIGGNGRALAPAAQPAGQTAAPETEAGVPGALPFHDAMILKFTPTGQFLMQIGKANHSRGSNDTENLRGPAKMWFDAKRNELYVADGYGNHRVIVFDAQSGKYKRHWGAYGNKPEDADLGRYNPNDSKPAQQFRNPVHCAVLSNDDLLYVCDRVNDRIQVFKPDGTFLREKFYYTKTQGDGSVWDIAFSRDPQQKYLYVADGSNEKVHILDRESLEELTNFGDGGRQPGQFYAVHSITTDSKGNIFTTETYRGQRVQKFVFKGIGPVTKMEQGVVWPTKETSPIN